MIGMLINALYDLVDAYFAGGQGDRDTANRAASTALYSSVIIGAVLIVLVGYGRI